MRWIHDQRKPRRISRNGFMATRSKRLVSWVSKPMIRKSNQNCKFTFKIFILSTNIRLWSHLSATIKAFGGAMDQFTWSLQTKASQASELKHLWRNDQPMASNSSWTGKISKISYSSRSIANWTSSIKILATRLRLYSHSLKPKSIVAWSKVKETATSSMSKQLSNSIKTRKKRSYKSIAYSWRLSTRQRAQ